MISERLSQIPQKLPEIEAIRKRMGGIDKTYQTFNPEGIISSKAARSEWNVQPHHIEQLYKKIDEMSEWIITKGDRYSTTLIGICDIKDGLVSLDDAQQRFSLGNKNFLLTADMSLVPDDTTGHSFSLIFEDDIHHTNFHFEIDNQALYELQLYFLQSPRNDLKYTYSARTGERKSVEEMTSEEFTILKYYLDRCRTEKL